MKTHGFVSSEKGQRIDNIPNTGTLTGHYFTDFYGCWWEYILDNIPENEPNGNQKQWIIGEYPNEKI